MGDDFSFADDYSDYYGSPSDFSNLDLSGLEGIDLSGLDFGETGLFDLEGLDFGEVGLNDLEGLDFGETGMYDLEGIDFGEPGMYDLEGLDFGETGLNDVQREIFNAARDSQIANELIEQQAPGFEQFGGNALGGYGVEPDSRATFNAARDSQEANRAIEAQGGDALSGYRAPGATPSNPVLAGAQAGTHSGTNVIDQTPGLTRFLQNLSGGNLGSLLPLLLAIMAARGGGGGGGGGSSATIPKLTATQTQTPYAATQRAPGYRPGQGGITYFNPVQYTPKMAAGGIADLSRGRLLHGPGDGVSDSIPAQIGSDQPARLARGEYVIDARTVAALGNGSTDAGAERLDQMRKKILRDDRKAGVGKDSKAYRHLKA